MFSFGTVAPHAHWASSLSPFPFSIDASKYLGFYLQVLLISPSSWFHKPLLSLMVVVVSKCLTTSVDLRPPPSPRDTGPLTFTLGHAILDFSSGVLHILIIFYFEDSSFLFWATFLHTGHHSFQSRNPFFSGFFLSGVLFFFFIFRIFWSLSFARSA